MTGQLDATRQGQVAEGAEEEKHTYIHTYIHRVGEKRSGSACLNIFLGRICFLAMSCRDSGKVAANGQAANGEWCAHVVQSAERAACVVPKALIEIAWS